jgi:hypothetical protein
MFEIPKNLEVRFINEEIGVGVFTTVNIKNGSLIETCYCLVMGSQDVTHPAYDYLFSTTGEKQLLPFGYGSIYNHDDQPNMFCDYDPNNEKLVRFYAIKDIKANEELRHSYGKKYWLARTKKII